MSARAVGRSRRKAVRLVAAGVAVSAATALASCSSSSHPAAPAANNAAITAVDPSSLSPNELRFGASPRPDKSVVYQPDVVVIGGGADSIRSASADGLIWTIKGNAPHADELRAGKVMLASGLAAGRVLAVADRGGDKQVVLGPADLTDFVREGHFASAGPIPLGRVEAYTAPTQPGTVTTFGDTASHFLTMPAVHFMANPGGAAPVAADPTPAPPKPPARPVPPALPLPPGVPAPVADPARLGNLPDPSPIPAGVLTDGYRLQPRCCGNGLGVHLNYAANGLTMEATLTLHLQAPSVEFKLDVDGGRVSGASIEVHGAGGFGIALQGASDNGDGDLDHQRVQIPTTFDVPLNVLGIPLSARLTQAFTLTTGFKEKAEFSAQGDYRFGATFGFSFKGGTFRAYGPITVQPVKKLTDTALTVAPGAAGMEVGYAARFSLAVGALGFEASAWFQIAFGVGVSATATVSALAPKCRTASLAIDVKYGLGYAIPKPIVAVVNFFLGLFHARPIQASGNFAETDPYYLVNMHDRAGGTDC